MLLLMKFWQYIFGDLAMVIYLIAKLEYTVWGSWALFRVVLPIKMYASMVRPFSTAFFLLRSLTNAKR